MKKTIFATLIIFFFISGCGSTPPTPGNIDQAASNTQIAEIVDQNLTAAVPAATQPPVPVEAGVLNKAYENAVSIEMQLLLGTFKLSGTDLAVTKEQVVLLLPLWTNLKTLNQSIMPVGGQPGQQQGDGPSQPPAVDEGTQAQIETTVKQIQAAMTTDQIKAIAEMKITQETAMTIMQEQGIQMDDPRQGSGDNSGGQAPSGGPMAGDPGGGGMGQTPQGTPPAGGPGGGQQPADGQAHKKGIGGERPDGGFLPTELIEALIQLLENVSIS